MASREHGTELAVSSGDDIDRARSPVASRGGGQARVKVDVGKAVFQHADHRPALEDLMMGQGLKNDRKRRRETPLKHLLQEYSEARCAVAIGVSRRSDKRSDGVLAGLAAFAAGHYREAERRYWQVLERRPGERTARVFLAESLLAQQRFEEATDVLDGLERSRVEDTALRYARALRIGLERGLYRSRPSVGSEIAFSAGDAAAAVVARRDHSPQYERSLR